MNAMASSVSSSEFGNRDLAQLLRKRNNSILPIHNPSHKDCLISPSSLPDLCASKFSTSYHSSLHYHPPVNYGFCKFSFEHINNFHLAQIRCIAGRILAAPLLKMYRRTFLQELFPLSTYKTRLTLRCYSNALTPTTTLAIYQTEPWVVTQIYHP